LLSVLKFVCLLNGTCVFCVRESGVGPTNFITLLDLIESDSVI